MDTFTVGDLVLSRDEHDLNGEVQTREVEEVFRRTAQVLEIRVGHESIRTTDEHPFWVVDKGWTVARELVAGDHLTSMTGQPVPITEIIGTQEWAEVFNLRVAEFHTYFVGGDEWGFSVWAHNALCVQQVVAEVENLLAAGKHFEKFPGSAKKVAEELSKGTAEGRAAALKELQQLEGVGAAKAEKIIYCFGSYYVDYFSRDANG